MSRVFLATLVGAIVCLLWGSVSWMALDWHGSTMLRFENEDAVARVMVENARKHGLYLLPNWMGSSGHAPTAESQAAKQKAEVDLQTGPFVYAVVRPGPETMSMGLNMGLAFARSFAACFIVALLLQQTSRLDYIQKVGFCVLCGLFAGLVSDVPTLIWFEAPLRFTLVNIADHLCEWFLAGLVMSAIVQGREGY